MLDLDKLHKHFLEGNIRERCSGKTIAVVTQAIGYTQVLEDTNIYILCLSEDKRFIGDYIHDILSDNESWFSTKNNREFYFPDQNLIILQTFEEYMNNDYMYLNHQPYNHLILWDYREETSVNNQPEIMYSIIQRTIGRVVGECAFEVSKALGGIEIKIDINK